MARLTDGRVPIEEHLDAIDRVSTPIEATGPRNLDPSAQIVTPPESPRPASPHPLEAHLLQLEEYEIERPPFYNKSTLAPELIFSAESLRHDAKVLARILVSFMAYAIRSHGTTNICDIGLYDRFEIWPNRPAEANSMPATVLNEKNLVYQKALKYAGRDMEERGLYIRKFSVRPEKKRRALVADWSVQMTPVVQNVQYPHHMNMPRSHRTHSGMGPLMQLPTPNELIRMHEIAHTNSRPESRANVSRAVQDGRADTFPFNQIRMRTVTNVSGQSSRRTGATRKPNRHNQLGDDINNCVVM